MLEELKRLDYKNVFKFFSDISAVPRGSGNNGRINRFLLDFADERGLRAVTDEAQNVIIYKPASPGYEESVPVIIQGHMDMVCVTDGTPHDFEREGLELFEEDGMLGARGTTLGGDDGIAIAYGLALLDDNTIPHPALEIVITTDEETGMYGAKALDAAQLKGRYMLNVDSEDEGVVLVSCAGGMRLDGRLELKTLEADGVCLRLEVNGLAGGHSGAEIHKWRTNATLLLARLLFELDEEYLLLDMKGGVKDNAIPSSSQAHIIVKPGLEREAAGKIAGLAEKYKRELEDSEKLLTVDVTDEGGGRFTAIHPISSEKVIFALINAPDGVQAMSHSIDGLVESSLNLGVFTASGNLAHFRYSLRSSVTTYKEYMRDRLTYMFEYLGGEAVFEGDYPAWEYRKESRLRDIFCRVFEEQYGREPKQEAIHAGLECGIISEKLPDADIVSIGPDMKDIHTPRERLDIASSIRVYRFLEKLLEALR